MSSSLLHYFTFPCYKRRPSCRENGGVSWVFSICGASVWFLTRYDVMKSKLLAVASKVKYDLSPALSAHQLPSSQFPPLKLFHPFPIS